MKRKFYFAVLSVIFSLIFIECRNYSREREIVILSTNDIHANISGIPRLATAVRQCRDTVTTILVDAGDRWTGNAYVDLADGRRPIIDLMNDLGYDIATLGNHEFDLGAEFLQNAIDNADFDIICANIKGSGDNLTNIHPYATIKTKNGLNIRFVGVVTNYDNGHPDGNNEIFNGLEFPDPMDKAQEYATGAEHSDITILLSHMSRDKDFEFAKRDNRYNVVIGGHSHDIVDTLIGRTIIGQTGCKLKNIGATRIRLKGHKIIDINYDNIPLDNYTEDVNFSKRVKEIENNPELHKRVGTLGVSLNKIGLADMQTSIVAHAMGSEIGFYHYGGIRLSELAAGDVSLSTLFDLEPFFSQIYTMNMTPEQMRNMIITKYNDTGNAKESHRIDLFCTAPYTIIVDRQGEAIDVKFPNLKDGVEYSVAMADYIAKKYSLDANNIQRHPTKVLDAMVQYFHDNSPVIFSNTQKQSIARQ